MTTAALSLPVSIPWKLIAVSPDMMDREYCGRGTPYHWRSSIAISAFEPKAEDLPEGLCDALAYLKISCTITGYQPSREEIEAGYVAFPSVPTSELQRVLENEYFGCYGAQISVAVHPPQTGPDSTPRALKDYPHIIDFEPKQRDFYQAATETGEILTSSNSAIQTDKSLTRANSTESGWKLGASIGRALGPASTVGGLVGSLSGEISHNRTQTDEANWTVHSDASRQWRETQGATTQISQMYNLLQSYHVGTNRAVFLMLPRPNTVQPTNRRTFVQGLRIIEGIQEFFLVVQRPRDMHGLCVEVNLETGHFPEVVEPPPVEYYEGKEEFPLRIDSTPGDDSETKEIPAGTTFTIPAGEHDMIIDTRPGTTADRMADPGHPGMQETIHDVNPDSISTSHYEYRWASENTVKVEGRVTFAPDSIIELGWAPDLKLRTGATIFARTYNVLTRSRQPKAPVGGVRTRLLVTRRQLCACLAQKENCLELVPTPEGRLRPGDVIVDEPLLILDTIGVADPNGRISHVPPVREALMKLHHAMAGGGRSLRRAAGPVGFLDSDYFKDRARAHMPLERLATRLGDLEGIPSAVRGVLGSDATVGAALDLDLGSFARATGLGLQDAAKARRAMLGEVSPEHGSMQTKRSE